MENICASAAMYCGVETLEQRGSDRLDFHDISVGSLKAALEHAYRSGYSAGKADGFERGLMIEVGN
jgi:hypothetical protein